MGILFNQRNEVWRIEIREKWLVPRTELDGVSEVLIDHKVPFAVSVIGNNIYIDMHNVSCEFKRFDDAQQALLELIGFKKKFGQLKPESTVNTRMREIFGGD